MTDVHDSQHSLELEFKLKKVSLILFYFSFAQKYLVERCSKDFLLLHFQNFSEPVPFYFNPSKEVK